MWNWGNNSLLQYLARRPPTNSCPHMAHVRLQAWVCSVLIFLRQASQNLRSPLPSKAAPHLSQRHCILCSSRKAAVVPHAVLYQRGDIFGAFAGAAFPVFNGPLRYVQGCRKGGLRQSCQVSDLSDSHLYSLTVSHPVMESVVSSSDIGRRLITAMP